jgi:hypothetical protein
VATRIVFSKDLTLEVEEDLAEVRRKLQTDEWPEFEAPTRGGSVVVRSDQVAYVQESARAVHSF